MRESPQQRALVRVCASCNWVFRGIDKGCPYCSFGSYGARWVFGNAAYRYEKTQKPWKDRMMTKYEMKLNAIIERKQNENS